jgi:hypothetical protein
VPDWHLGDSLFHSTAPSLLLVGCQGYEGPVFALGVIAGVPRGPDVLEDRQAVGCTAPHVLAAGFAQAVAHLAAGDLVPEIVVVDGLAGAAQAQQALAKSRAPGKQVVRV